MPVLRSRLRDKHVAAVPWQRQGLQAPKQTAICQLQYGHLLCAGSPHAGCGPCANLGSQNKGFKVGLPACCAEQMYLQKLCCVHLASETFPDISTPHLLAPTRQPPPWL